MWIVDRIMGIKNKSTLKGVVLIVELNSNTVKSLIVSPSLSSDTLRDQGWNEKVRQLHKHCYYIYHSLHQSQDNYWQIISFRNKLEKEYIRKGLASLF